MSELASKNRSSIKVQFETILNRDNRFYIIIFESNVQIEKISNPNTKFICRIIYYVDRRKQYSKLRKTRSNGPQNEQNGHVRTCVCPVPCKITTGGGQGNFFEFGVAIIILQKFCRIVRNIILCRYI